MSEYRLKVPFDKDEIKKLVAGDRIYLSGKILTGRDAAHKRLFECVKNGEAFAPTLYDEGVLATIGKGDRSKEVYEAIVRNGGVYLATIGGAGALYAQCIKSAKVLAYEELGAEAVYEFEVDDMPCVVAIDSEGKTIYKNSLCAEC